ncbi:putative serine/threonine-protein kinase GCN2 [Hibiscus syriacus]|uniref:non-specific serine/threonine protein kinase n=2 Tax=Hibiscus syriacus TaxID=106335 RepID=A0A6A3CLY8_HIBSY|nr:putative serine/threonine-protein kinase GCN2 [Hibiscus syriacus]
MRNTKHAIKKWSGNRDKYPGALISELEKKISLIEDDIQQKKEQIWFQYSRTKWVEDGDRNTKYFHTCATIRNKRNALLALNFKGETVEDPTAIKAIEFSEEEAWDVVKSCGSNKAPGPDGFNLGFFKRFWQVLKMDRLDFEMYHISNCLSFGERVPTEEILMAKGLRQGCSLSPLLFNIVGELLNLLILKVVSGGLFSGLVIRKEERNFNLTHLQFADDLIMFCGPHRNSNILWDPVIQSFNKRALLEKWAWRFAIERKAVWREMLCIKYKLDPSLMQFEKANIAIKLAMGGIRFGRQLGNGSSFDAMGKFDGVISDFSISADAADGLFWKGMMKGFHVKSCVNLSYSGSPDSRKLNFGSLLFGGSVFMQMLKIPIGWNDLKTNSLIWCRLASWFLAKETQITISKDDLIADPSIVDSYSSHSNRISTMFPGPSSKGFKDRLIESDSKVAIGWVKDVVSCPVVYVQIVKDIIQKLSVYEGFISGLVGQPIRGGCLAKADILRTMQTSEDTSVYDKVVNAIFDEKTLATKSHHQNTGRLGMVHHDTTSIQFADLDTELRDFVAEVSREVFKKHCAKHLEIVPMHLLDDCTQFSRNTVKLLTHGGDMLELCHELRLPFVKWIVVNQKFSFKRYEISYVYRRAIGHSPPNRYLQGDFDIIGGASALTEAEVLKVTVNIVSQFFNSELCDIHLNHGNLLEAIWIWAGVNAEHRLKVAELLSMMACLRPQSSERKLKWVVIRRQLLQELNLAEATVNRLQTVSLRFCGAVDQALPRLRGALPADKPTRKALDELSDLFSYLRIWRIEKHVYIDPLMPPTENYHRDLFFQIYLGKESHPGALTEGSLLAVGGRYDYLLHQMWDCENKTNPPGAVGTSLALETIIQHSPEDFKPIRNEPTTSILVCSRGGGGLLRERMELVAELWEENIKAELVPVPDPSLTEQYEFASEHEIKCLVIITEMGVSQTGFVKVRHLDLKKGKEVQREDLVRFLLNAMGTQFRNPSVWSQ